MLLLTVSVLVTELLLERGHIQGDCQMEVRAALLPQHTGCLPDTPLGLPCTGVAAQRRIESATETP